MSHRLKAPFGHALDRARMLRFTFDGVERSAFAGDTLASALFANDVKLVGRSFKYHRPRGVFSAGVEEPNALVELRAGARREPNVKATGIEVFDGLMARSQNRWPSLEVDFMSVNSLFAPLLVGGFYYKTFMWPASFWERLYEPLIRRAAGLGRGATLPDPDLYEKSYGFCDLLVIGAGPTGLMAALSAAEAGARVILCDEDNAFGGRLLADDVEVDGVGGAQYAAQAAARLAALPNVRMMARTSVFGAYDHGTYGALERVADHIAEPMPGQPRQRLWKFVARRAVLAAGAYERSLVFGGNDLPGVMQASAMRAYIQRFGVAPARRIAVFTASDDGWTTAALAAKAGVDVAAVVDMRAQASPDLIAMAGKIGALALMGAQVTDARGGRALAAIDVRKADGATLRLKVDGLAVSGGFNPNIGLAAHHGHRPVWRDEIAAFVPQATPPGMVAAGAAAGEFGLAECLAAGLRAVAECGFSSAVAAPRCSADSAKLAAFFHVAGARKKAFVDLQHDVTDLDIKIAHQEGYRAVEHLKRYTTLGMATDQGKTGGVPGMAIMSALTGRAMGETGVTMARPPHAPVAISAFAGTHRGKHFRATRRTPMHDWAAGEGASFIEAGAWLRAEYFAHDGQSDWLALCTREVTAVRSRVGFCDVSTLGKIDVMGADAGAFLDRIYCNTFSTLPVGKVRYSLMLREDGMVMDDGTSARLAEDHYLMSTTTAHAAQVMQHLEFCHQVYWPELDVQLASVSEQWAQVSLAGPRARDVLARIVDGDVSDAALPYMGVLPVVLNGGVKARVFRISFSGELAYEIAAPARFGEALALALMRAGAEFGVTPYGLEALNVMRIEKGHVTGNELNGQTTAADVGMGRMMSPKKDFIGKTLAQRPALTASTRPALAGFRPLDRSQRLRAGAHFIARGAAGGPPDDEGHCTSAAFSPELGHWIALGLIRGGPQRHGEIVRAYDPLRGDDIEVEICPPVFIDPKGERLRG